MILFSSFLLQISPQHSEFYSSPLVYTGLIFTAGRKTDSFHTDWDFISMQYSSSLTLWFLSSITQSQNFCHLSL